MNEKSEFGQLRFVVATLIGWLVPNTLRPDEAVRLLGWLNGTEPIPEPWDEKAKAALEADDG